MPTLAFIFSATGLLNFAMLLVLGSLLRADIPGTRHWLATNLCLVAALPLLTLRGVIPDFVSVVIANLLVCLSGVFYYAGCAHFLQRRPHWPRLLAGTAATVAAIAFWRYVEDDIPMRVLAATTFATIIFLAVANLMLRRRPPHRSPYNYWFTAGLALAFAACQAARGIYFLTLPGPSGPQMFDTLPNAALLSIGAVIMPIMTMAAIMLIHDAMLADVEDAANHDHMTGALSRRKLELLGHDLTAGSYKRKRALPKLSSRPSTRSTARSGTRPYTRALARPLSLLIIDLDHFKKINDTYGHAAGDEVLREFVTQVRGSLRDADALGRLGGEEFGILLPDTEAAAAMSIAERLREQSEAHLVRGAFGECRYSISVGVATWTEGETFDGLSARADRALYLAKNGGRNRVCADETSPDISLASAGMHV